MKQVTRDIDPGDARDLLERVPRACLAYAGEGGPQVWPVALEWREERYWVRLPENVTLPPGAGQEVVLLVDEGVHYFDLRAIYIRGEAGPGAASANEAWLEVIPTKMVAWDYGAMREVPHEPG